MISTPRRPSRAKKAQDPPSLDQLLSEISRRLRAGDVGEATDTFNMALILYPRNRRLIAKGKEIPELYGKPFYDEHSKGSLRSARILLSILHRYHDFKSVVDFGAGNGTWLRAASSCGAKELVAIEGEWVKAYPRKFRGATYRYANLNARISVEKKFDLAVSAEVAEHLDPSRGPSFVADLCRASDVVAFGAGPPREQGTGHINCRPQSYWIEQFDRRGFTCLDAFRPVVWYDKRVEPWYRQDMFLFVAARRLRKFARIPRPSLVNVYHPLMYNQAVFWDHLKGVIDPRSP